MSSWPSVDTMATTADARAVSLRPPLLALGLAGLALALHAALWGAAAPLGRVPALGGPLLALGLTWMLWAAALFRRAGTTIRPTGRPAVLVDEGPFRFGRNPMYLGMAAALLGLGLLLGSPLVAASALAFAAVLDRVHIPFEEAQLRRQFGGWYSDYAAEVRRWF